MTNINFHFAFEQGRTLLIDDQRHIRNMIEQFLFTNPGERVNRPDFGSGLLGMIFEPVSNELVGLLQHTIHAGLQQWLNDVMVVNAVLITIVESLIRVEISYTLLRTSEVRSETFERSVA